MEGEPKGKDALSRKLIAELVPIVQKHKPSPEQLRYSFKIVRQLTGITRPVQSGFEHQRRPSVNQSRRDRPRLAAGLAHQLAGAMKKRVYAEGRSTRPGRENSRPGLLPF